jgi:hypothetical protein
MIYLKSAVRCENLPTSTLPPVSGTLSCHELQTHYDCAPVTVIGFLIRYIFLQTKAMRLLPKLYFWYLISFSITKPLSAVSL